MEQVNNQVERALHIIENVKDATKQIQINKHQCRRLANHFQIVGNSLYSWKEMCKGVLTNNEEKLPFLTKAFNNLFLVLKRGEALVLDYKVQHWLTRLLTRADNHESFEDIHRELETCSIFLWPSEFSHTIDNNVNFDAMIGEQQIDMTQDQREMLGTLESLYDSPPFDHTQEDLQGVRDILNESFEACENNEYETLDDVPSYFKVDTSNLTLGEPLARGFDWQVKKAMWLGCNVAIRCQDGAFDSTKVMMMYKDAGFLNRLRHPQVVQVVGVSQFPSHYNHDNVLNYNMIMELMDGNLHRLMEERMIKNGGRVPFNQREAIDIIIQIARAIQHLHMKGCMHKALKPYHVLFNDHNDYVNVKISHFGVSHQVAREDVYFNNSTFTLEGAPRWVAPEVIRYFDDSGQTTIKAYSGKADIYSFGMTCYQILTGKVPFEDVRNGDILSHIMANCMPILPFGMNEKLRDLIQDCWALNPTCRPTASEVCARLDEIKRLATHDNGLMRFAITKKFLNLTRPTIHRTMRFFSLLGRSDFEDIETLGGGPLLRLDGGESSSTTLDIQGLPRYFRMDPSTFQVVRRIHGDEEGQVQVIEINIGGCKFAIKIFKNCEGQEQHPSFRFELDFLIKLNHPHIVRLMGYSLDPIKTAIVLEWMPKDLQKLIDSRKRTSIMPFSRLEAKDLITQIASGMAYLHKQGVFHRDLKAKNVLIHEYPNHLHAKVTDFGQSQYVHVVSNVGVGTRYWRAPEISKAMRDNRPFEYTAKADVFSFGIVCYEILSGEDPCDFLIVEGLPKQPSLSGNPNDPLNMLVTSCWEDALERRPTFEDIITKLQSIGV